MTLHVICIEPIHSGNVGAIARVMKNFGFRDLVLINPQCKIDAEAFKRAAHAQTILKKAKIEKKSFLKKFDYLVGTTAMLGTDYNIPRSPLSPEQLAEKIKSLKKVSIGLVVGRDDKGLTNKEIQLCDFVVTIPASKKYPTLNISHAVGILLYELSKVRRAKKVSSHILFAGKKEKEHLLKKIDAVIDSIEFKTEQNKKTQQIIWKRLIGKSFLTKREAFALHGFFRKLKK